MSITVITPVGPGHEEVVLRCMKSVERSLLPHLVVDDKDGSLGRSAARNMALFEVETKWVMFLDADDELAYGGCVQMEKAIRDNPSTLGFFGAIYGRSRIKAHKDRPFSNLYPQSNSEILRMDSAAGLFCLSGVFDAESAKSIGFHPGTDRAESLEFALAFCAKYPDQWSKVCEPFTFIHCETPSATGPRGYDHIDWLEEIQPLFDFWKKRKLEPMTQKERFASRYWEC